MKIIGFSKIVVVFESPYLKVDNWSVLFISKEILVLCNTLVRPATEQHTSLNTVLYYGIEQKLSTFGLNSKNPPKMIFLRNREIAWLYLFLQQFDKF